jgi:hypothetical protein
MTVLIATMWAVYLSECLVRVRPGDWVFRRNGAGTLQGTDRPDFALLDGRWAFVMTSPLPWAEVYRCSAIQAGRKRARVALGFIHRRLRGLVVSTTVLFVLLLVVLPALIWTEQLVPWRIALAVSLGTVWATTLAMFFAAHITLLGRAPALESWLVVALSPLSLIRASTGITLQLSRGTHPVSAAASLCEEAEFLRIARLWHFDEPELRPVLARLAKRHQCNQELFAPPRDPEPGVALFCRRCHATYRAGARDCVDCNGVPLTVLPLADSVLVLDESPESVCLAAPGEGVLGPRRSRAMTTGPR